MNFVTFMRSVYWIKRARPWTKNMMRRIPNIHFMCHYSLLHPCLFSTLIFLFGILYIIICYAHILRHMRVAHFSSLCIPLYLCCCDVLTKTLENWNKNEKRERERESRTNNIASKMKLINIVIVCICFILYYIII